MSNLPLPRLMPEDSENLLSHGSRQRIATALIDAERIRSQALSTLETRYRAEASGGVGFAEYLSSGSAFIDLTESRMEAARTVLRVEAEEYRKLGLPDSQFRKIMRERIEGTVYSLEMSSLQDRALEVEFVFATSQQAEDEPRSKNVSNADTGNILDDAAASHLHPERAADRVKAFMHKKGLTKRAFAKMIGTSERTVGYVLAGVRVGKETRVLVAKALGTTPEELFRE
jgi:lambda repressor-like predicted transcriptional regulator